MNTFRILVADDHPIFRFGACTLLASHEGWEVCGEAVDGRDAVEKCKQLKPDLLILDIGMPNLNGVDAARQILKHNPDQRILILTHVDSEEVIRHCLEAGVRGWVFKSEAADELTTAVEILQRHRCVFSPRVSDLILHGYRRNQANPSATTISKLSPREREVVQLTAGGKTSKEVALALNVTVKTVDSHRSNIFNKLGLHSTVEVVHAVRNNIIQVQPSTVLHFPQPGNGHATAAPQMTY